LSARKARLSILREKTALYSQPPFSKVTGEVTRVEALHDDDDDAFLFVIESVDVGLVEKP
jgi:hypothetical protein